MLPTGRKLADNTPPDAAAERACSIVNIFMIFITVLNIFFIIVREFKTGKYCFLGNVLDFCMKAFHLNCDVSLEIYSSILNGKNL